MDSGFILSAQSAGLAWGYLVHPWVAAVLLKQRGTDGFAHAVRVHAHPPALVLKLVDGELAHEPPQRACNVTTVKQPYQQQKRV